MGNEDRIGISVIRSHTLNLPAENVDTDQIYPSRFLTTTQREDLGHYCFLDWRTSPDSQFYEYFQNYCPEQQQILVSGINFGCGSSREHAVWSLLGMGIRAVISSRFGDIFESNAIKNGLVLVQVKPEALAFLLQRNNHPVSIDIKTATVQIKDYGTVKFELDAFSAYCLLNGIDSLDYLLAQMAAITGFEQPHSK